jgi:hypothetical protein
MASPLACLQFGEARRPKLADDQRLRFNCHEFKAPKRSRHVGDFGIGAPFEPRPRPPGVVAVRLLRPPENPILRVVLGGEPFSPSIGEGYSRPSLSGPDSGFRSGAPVFRKLFFAKTWAGV